jgi:O-antigen ligase
MLYAFILSFPVALKTPVIILLILLWLSDLKTYKSTPEIIKKIFSYMLLFLSFVLLSTLWSDASFKDMAIYIKKFWYFLPMLIIYKYIKKEYIIYALSSFLLGMFVSEVLSYGVYFSLWKIRFATPLNPSIFLHHIQYSIFLSLTAIILLFRGLKESGEMRKIIYFTFFTTVTLNLFINVGRTGYVTFIAATFMSLFIIYKFKLRVMLLSFIGILAMVFLVYTISPNFKTRINQGVSDIKLLKQTDYDTSIGARVALWMAAKQIFINNPILGVGVANHLKKKDEFAKSNSKFEFLTKISHFHNSFLEVLTQFGIIGLIIFIYILYLISTIPIKDTNIRILKISMLTIFILGSFSDRLFHLNSTMSLFAFISALIYAQFKFEIDSSST